MMEKKEEMFATLPHAGTNQADGRSTSQFDVGIVGETGGSIDTATLRSPPVVCF